MRPVGEVLPRAVPDYAQAGLSVYSIRTVTVIFPTDVSNGSATVDIIFKEGNGRIAMKDDTF